MEMEDSEAPQLLEARVSELEALLEDAKRTIADYQAMEPAAEIARFTELETIMSLKEEHTQQLAARDSQMSALTIQMEEAYAAKVKEFSTLSAKVEELSSERDATAIW